MQKEFICTHCSEKSQLKEIFRDISLELGEEQSSRNLHHFYNLRSKEKRPVSGLLANYFLAEKLERSCENCKSSTASVNKKIFTLPRVLVIHLKRFQHSKTGFFVHKLHDKIMIDSKIDIKSYGREAQVPIHFNKETELSDYLKKKVITKIDTTKEEEDDDLKKALAESKLTGLTEDEQLKIAIENSEKEYYTSLTHFDMTKTTMELNESENSPDYNSETDSMNDDDPILKEFEQLNIPRYGIPTTSDAPVIPPDEEIKLLDRSEFEQHHYPNPYTYHLQAIVKHKGDSASSGHYVTNILDENNQWNCYDDTSVYKLTEEQAIRELTEKEAYILFYVHSSIFQKLV